MSHDNHRKGLYLAAGAALVFSPAAVFVRLAGSLNIWEITCLRLIIAGMTMALAALWTKTPLKPPKEERKQLALFAFITAFHFSTFTAALERTSIAHSLALTYTAPVFAALIARFFIKEELTGRQWLGILLVVFSVAWMCFGFSTSDAAMLGDGMALLSGLSLGIYHVIGRSAGRKIPLFRYAFWLYFGAGIYLLPLAWPFPSTYGKQALLALFLQGAFCTGVGHTLTNAALRYTTAAYVSLIVTQEVTGGILVGALALNEYPKAKTLFALLPLIVGLALVLGRLKPRQ